MHCSRRIDPHHHEAALSFLDRDAADCQRRPIYKVRAGVRPSLMGTTLKRATGAAGQRCRGWIGVVSPRSRHAAKWIPIRPPQRVLPKT